MVLRGTRGMIKRIESLNMRIQSLREQMEKITPSYTEKTSGSGEVDKLGKLYAEIDQLERERVDLVVELASEQRMTENAIEKLPENEQIVMRFRYVNGLTMSEVAEQAHYSERWAKTLHRRAKERLARVAPSPLPPSPPGGGKEKKRR